MYVLLFKQQVYFHFLILLLSLIISCSSYAQISATVLEQLKKEHIVDTTQTLIIDQIQHIQQQNEQLYDEENVDFKILMIPSTQGESIEEYALDVFNTLKIGNEKLDNGLLLVIGTDGNNIYESKKIVSVP